MNKVTVYSNQSCIYCSLVKNYLNEEGVLFEEVDVDADPSLIQMLLQESGQMGLPQTKVGNRWIVGYDRVRIHDALKNEEENKCQ